MILSAWLKFQSLFLHRPFECDRRKEGTAARVALAFVFAAVRLLPSPVISKELDVLLAMVAALRSELDEVQLLPIVSSFAAVILSADLWSFSVDSFQDCAFIKFDGCH